MKRLLGLILPAAVLAAWYVASNHMGVPRILLPSPQAVFEAFVSQIASGELFAHIASSASRSLAGFVLSATLGIGLGVLFATHDSSKRFCSPLIEAVRITPPLSLIPLLILWLGIDEAPKIAIVFLSSFYPIYLNALTAVSGVDKKLAEVARLMNFTRAETFRHLTLPSALPSILAGLRIGFGYSWRALVGAELVAASSGLGFLITESSEFGNTDIVFVGIITIFVLGVMADRLLSKAVEAVCRRTGRRV